MQKLFHSAYFLLFGALIIVLLNSDVSMAEQQHGDSISNQLNAIQKEIAALETNSPKAQQTKKDLDTITTKLRGISNAVTNTTKIKDAIAQDFKENYFPLLEASRKEGQFLYTFAKWLFWIFIALFTFTEIGLFFRFRAKMQQVDAKLEEMKSINSSRMSEIGTELDAKISNFQSKYEKKIKELEIESKSFVEEEARSLGNQLNKTREKMCFTSARFYNEIAYTNWAEYKLGRQDKNKLEKAIRWQTDSINILKRLPISIPLTCQIQSGENTSHIDKIWPTTRPWQRMLQRLTWP